MAIQKLSGTGNWPRKFALRAVILVAIAVLGFLHPTSTLADSVWATHDWDPAPGTWSSEYGWVVTGTPVSGGVGDSGFLSVTFTNTSVGTPDGTWADIVNTPGSSLFAGDYSISNWFQFDFFASNVLPNDIQVRWQSTTNSYIWGSDVTGPTSTGAWETLRSGSLLNWEDWVTDPFATEEEFLSDLNDIWWVGIYIERFGNLEQLYGIDNFSLMIPEPAEIIMLAFALIGVVIAVRRPKARASPSS